MAPKKKETVKARPVLGRFKNSLKMGIVGLPNVGKSTFFNTLTKLNVPAENFPFCTIEPNEARVPLPDERFNYLCDVHKPASKVRRKMRIFVSLMYGYRRWRKDIPFSNSSFSSFLSSADQL